MKTKQLTTEHALYVLALLLALGMRLFNLGAAPLSDFEAGWALQALDISKGAPVSLGPQPAYVLLTSLLFSLFGSANALARLVPALAGSALVLLPLLFRRLLADETLSPEAPPAIENELESLPSSDDGNGLRFAGLIVAFGLALDPGLVTLSRLAGGPMPAIACVLLALALAYQRRAVLAGLFGGLALLSGPAVIQGVLGLALAWGLVRLLQNAGQLGSLDESQTEIPSAAFWRTGLYFGVGVLLLAGTLFLRVPQGLGAFASTLPAYLDGWTAPSGIPAMRLPVALLVYQPLVLVFAVLGAARAWFSAHPRGRSLARGLTLWALIALALAILYPARHIVDLAWALVPLWGLAAFELGRHVTVDQPTSTRVVALGQAALLFALLTLAWLNLLSLTRFQTNQVLYGAVIGAALVMGAVATMLVAAGWSLDAARLGLVWGLGAALIVGLLATSWGAAHLRANNIAEFWSIPPGTGQVDLLLDTLGDLSEWHTGHRETLDVVVTVDLPSLRWALRGYSQARFAPDVVMTETPAVIITRVDEETPSLALSYRGQDFDYRIYPGWGGILPEDWTAWLTYRRAPSAPEQVILWARGDLFPGGELPLAEEIDEPPDEFIIPEEVAP